MYGVNLRRVAGVIYLSLSFFICKEGIIRVSVLQDC